MTIIIPYKPDIHEGLELRYCLRSIEKNLTGFTDLVIVGRPPHWFNGHHFFVEDLAGRKQCTIYNKLLFACTNFADWDNFLKFNDDHFLLKPLQVSDIKYWHNGLLSNELYKGLSIRYREAVVNTLKEMPEAFNFDIHTPIIYNKNEFRRIFRTMVSEVCIKSYYCNSLNIEGEKMDDCKIDSLLSEEAIKVRIKDKLFLSTGSNAIREPMKKLLEELFPKPSRWEAYE